MYHIENRIKVHINHKIFAIITETKQYENKDIAKIVDKKLKNLKLKIENKINKNNVKDYNIEKLAYLIYESILEINKVTIINGDMSVTYMEDF